MQLFTNIIGAQEITEGRLSIDSDTGLPCLPLIWDTEVDGELSEELLAQIGGLKRVKDVLVFDQATKDADDAAKLALEPSADEKRRDAYMAIPEYEFREALYEARKGNTAKFDAYGAKVEAIKAQFPKS